MTSEQVEQLKALLYAASDLDSKARDHLLPYNFALAIKRVDDAASACNWVHTMKSELPEGCHRSHPHENMSHECVVKTDVARGQGLTICDSTMTRATERRNGEP